ELSEAAGAGQERLSYRADSDGVTFTAPPAERETEITGPVAARLFVSSTAADADLFCVLRLLRPGGREITFPGAIDPHTPPRPGRAPPAAQQARPAAEPPLPALPQPR